MFTANSWERMHPETLGSCYGFDITSELPLSFLRTGTGSGIPMSIRFGSVPEDNGRLLQEWNMGRAGKSTTRLFELGPDHFLIRVGDNDSFEVLNREPSIIVHSKALSETQGESMIWGTPAAVSMAHQGHLPIHSGSVDIDGHAVLLAATGAFGKTTLAGAFHAAGYRLLADDMSCAITDPGPAILPGPAVIRARPDVVAGFDFKRTKTIQTTPGRTHFALNLETRGNGDPVPLSAIVFLRISDGPIHLEPAPISDAVRDLYGLSYRSPTDDGRGRGFEASAQLAGAVPVWNLYRPLNLETLPEVIEAIVQTCLG